MQKAIFIFDAKDAIIIAEIDTGKANGIHITHVSSLRSDTRARPEDLPKNPKSSTPVSEKDRFIVPPRFEID